MRKVVLLATLALVALLALPAMAGPIGGTVYFSYAVSDPTPPAWWFPAQIVWNYDGVGTFEMTVMNQTTDPPGEYILSEIFWNVDGVQSLALTGDGGFAGWSMATNISADGFGTFDYKLDLGAGATGIAPGESATFTFTVTAIPGEDPNFFSHLSIIPPGANPAIGAVKWQAGPGDDSAYTTGGTDQIPIVPEPATNMLLGIGIAAMLIRRKMRKTA